MLTTLSPERTGRTHLGCSGQRDQGLSPPAPGSDHHGDWEHSLGQALPFRPIQADTLNVPNAPRPPQEAVDTQCRQEHGSSREGVR